MDYHKQSGSHLIGLKIFQFALFIGLVVSLSARSAAGQYPGAEMSSSTVSNENSLGPQQACYLGGGDVRGPSNDDSGMAPGADPYTNRLGSAPPYSQQEGSTEEGIYPQSGANGESAYSSAGQTYPLDQSVQDSSVDEAQNGVARGLSNMSADQIIAILQQAPDTLTTFRDLAGQIYGVDPATIPDSGVYNCIRQDPSFRSQVSAQLTSEGYIASPESPANRQQLPEQVPGNQSSPPANGTFSQRYQKQYPYQNQYQYQNPYGERRFPPFGIGPTEQPGELRRQTPTPYPNLPSLRDLYSQEVQDGRRLRRFGSDAFLFGTGNANLLPMDLPVGPDYVLGPGDNLIVNMWGSQSARLSRTVDRQGEIALPEAGTITVAGLTIAQAQISIQKVLGTQFQDEHAELSLGRVRTVRVYVVGDVQRPGAYDVSSLSTPLNALYEAGGPTSRGSLRTLKHYRGNQLIQEIDLYDFLLRGIRADVDRLMPGDTILVPPAGAQVTVAGMVRRPAIYELRGENSLKDILDLAGGVLVSADLKEIRIERTLAHERHTMLRVQVPDGAAGESGLPDFQVQDGDSIQVSPILPYNDQVVYLEGHVFKPGRYAWREGMTVSDLVHSYQDVMPEPAAHAEIVRLIPPDLHPQTISFNLPEELVGNDPITLQPFDTVRIFGRYQIDPPKVSIFGAVLRPGSYPMSQGMTVAGLVRMAGGFRRSAYREVADLSSYTIKDGQKVLIRHSEVAISKALDGDKNEDQALQPGDVVGIRQLSGWNDIGSSITLTGEVNYAGTYGIQDGERLSSVLRRAGGFRPDAYPEGAVLERVQVRQLEENNRQELIRRVESTTPTVSQGVNSTSQEQLSQLQAMQQQRQDVLAALRTHPSTGRLVIKISSDIRSWENTPADIQVRAGDRLFIPKHPDFVLVAGQVNNATGITYRPGKDAGWYLRQAGGVTRSGDKKAIFVLRADGSVVGNQKSTVWSGGVLSVKMHPGDSVIVPEKVIGGSQLWRNIIGTAQIASSVALTGAVAGVF